VNWWKTAGTANDAFSGTGGLTPIAERGTRWRRRELWDSGSARRSDSGALVGGSYDWNGRGIDDLEPVPDSGEFAGSPTQYEAIDVREYRYYRTVGNCREPD